MNIKKHNPTRYYLGFRIVQMHNMSGKLKYYIGNDEEVSNQEWPSVKMAEKVIRTIGEIA